MRITYFTQFYPPMIGVPAILVEQLANAGLGVDNSSGHCRNG